MERNDTSSSADGHSFCIVGIIQILKDEYPYAEIKRVVMRIP